jgi:predicted TIM-barrel fold metal-dependent hydrolase
MQQRRQFLAQTGAAATATWLLADAWPNHLVQAQTPVNNDTAIIDCHQHLWDLEKLKLPWIKPGTLLGRSYVMTDYYAAIAGTGIKNAVYMEVDVEASQKQAEADHLIAICKSGAAPTIAAVVGGRPGAEGFAEYAKQFKGSDYVKGIRQVLHGGTPAGHCLQDNFVRDMQLLGDLGLSFDLCLRPKELGDGAALAEKCPHTRFILDHCGNADPEAFLKAGDSRLADAKLEHQADEWRRGIDKVASAKNTICKISGIVARVPKQWSADDLAPIVNHCLDAFGSSRVIFGSDWPVCLSGAPLKDWVAALNQIIAARPVAEQRQLLRENAIKFYGLQLA